MDRPPQDTAPSPAPPTSPAGEAGLELLRERVRSLEATLAAEVAAARRSSRRGRILCLLLTVALVLGLGLGHRALRGYLGNAETVYASAERWADESLPALSADLEQDLRDAAPRLAADAAAELARAPAHWRSRIEAVLVEQLADDLASRLIARRKVMRSEEHSSGASPGGLVPGAPYGRMSDTELKAHLRRGLEIDLRLTPPTLNEWLAALGARLEQLGGLARPTPEERAAQEAAATLADLLARATAGTVEALPREAAKRRLEGLLPEPTTAP